MAVLPIVLTTAGWSPTPPATFQANLVAGVSATNPGYTANLPLSLIEDISSTDVFALVTCDAAFGESINSISPSTANAYLLALIGTMLGIPIGTPTNTSVYVIFSGQPGFTIATGWVVSDGTYQYTVQYPGGVIESGNASAPLYCVATIAGSWAVPAGIVNQLITQPPTGFTLSCNNLEAGVPGGPAETEASYRSRVFQANLAASQGMPRYLKTLVMAVSGVQPQLVSVLQQPGGGWSVIVGGGDPYAVAFAIFTALFDVSTLVGAVIEVSGATKATPGVITTSIDHNYITGQVAIISGSTVSAWNGTYTITVLSPTTFSIGVDTTGYTTYVSGGVVNPVIRNINPSLIDYPNSYSVPFINPPQQLVAITVTWNTNASLFYVNPSAISQLATVALVAYINSITVGDPINILQMDAAFQLSVASVLPAPYLTRLVFAVSINGTGVSPSSGTQIIIGDPSSYFYTNSSEITVNQG